MAHPNDAEVRKERAATLHRVVPGADYEHPADKASRLSGGKENDATYNSDPVVPRPTFPVKVEKE